MRVLRAPFLPSSSSNSSSSTGGGGSGIIADVSANMTCNATIKAIKAS